MVKKRTRRPQTKLMEAALTEEGFAKSRDGTKIWYKSVGRGTPIICCNGLGCSTFYFNYLEDYFKYTNQVITWDYRGHGQSEKPHSRKHDTITALTDDLRAVMETLDIKRAVMIGHSMGSQVIYEFYSRYPQRCLALISCFGTFEKPIDTFLDSPFSKYVFEVIYVFNHLFPRLSNVIGTLMLKNPLWFQVGAMLKIMKPYLVDKEILRQYINHIVNVDPIFLSNLTKSMQQHSSEESLKKIKVPTLIIGADEDNFTPVWLAKKMHHLIPESELFVVKKASHVALVEQPELINLRIEKFLNERLMGRRRPVKPLLKGASSKRSTSSPIRLLA